MPSYACVGRFVSILYLSVLLFSEIAVLQHEVTFFFWAAALLIGNMGKTCWESNLCLLHSGVGIKP